LLLGQGDGTFAAKVNYQISEYPGSVVAADFDGDGIIDIAVANETDTAVSVLLGRG